MKYFFPYQFKLLAVVCVLFALQSCSPAKPGVYKDDQISGGQRNDFHKLNDEALSDIKGNNLKIFQEMMSQEMIDRQVNERLLQLMNNHLADHPYKLLEEYYVVREKTAKDTAPYKVAAQGTDVNRHGLKFTAVAHETYIAFLAPEKADSKSLITLVYSKLNYGWKITDMDIEEYTVDGMTGPELYELAKKEYDKKQLFNVVNNLAMANKCFSPSPVWAYEDTTGASALADKALNEANKKYRYPINLTGVSTAPRIIAVTTERDGEWTAPSIWYQTHYNLHGDTTKIKNENLEVQKAVGKLFPGIDEDNRYIKYVAFNEYPSSAKSVDRFEMFQKLK